VWFLVRFNYIPNVVSGRFNTLRFKRAAEARRSAGAT